MKYQNEVSQPHHNIDALQWRALCNADSSALARMCSICNADPPHTANTSEHETPATASTFVANTSAWHENNLVGCVVLQKKDGLAHLRELSLEIIVVPEWQTDDVAEHITNWLAEALSQAQHYCPSGREVHFYASVRNSDQWLTRLLETANFRPERMFVDMSMALSKNDGLPATDLISSFRPIFSEELRQVCNEAFDGHWGTTPWSAQSWQDDVVGCPDFLPELSYLLFSPNTQQLIAFVLTSRSGGNTTSGESNQICIDLVGTCSEFRGQGIASRLLAHTLAKAAEQGFVNAKLIVDTDGAHNALSLYEKLGFRTCNWLTMLTLKNSTPLGCR